MPAAPQSSSAAAAVRRQSRSASVVVAKAAKGFHVFRIDGYSLIESLPGGECVSSQTFAVGGHRWRVCFYPNGADGSTDDSTSVSLFLRMRTRYNSKKERVRAQYKFSLLDAATGHAAYELPATTGIFTCPSLGGKRAWEEPDQGRRLRCGYAEFISKEAMERRRESLIRDDCMAIRCDVCVTVVKTVSIGVEHSRSGNDSSDSSDDSSGSSSDCFVSRSDNSDGSSDCSESRDDSSDSSHSNSYGDSFGNIVSSDSSDSSSSDSSHDSDDSNDGSSNCNDDSSDSSDDSSGNSHADSYSDLFGNIVSSDGSDFPDSSDSSDGSDSSDSSSDSSDISDSGMETRHRSKRHRPDLNDTEYVKRCLAERRGA